MSGDVQQEAPPIGTKIRSSNGVPQLGLDGSQNKTIPKIPADKYCNARRKNNTYCRQTAGHGTDHVGRGRCKLHGGAVGSGGQFKHGRYSLRRASLNAKMEQFRADPRPGNMLDELALARSVLQEFLDQELKSDGDLTDANISTLMYLTREITLMVERIARVLNQTALTQAEVLFLQQVIFKLVVKYIDDPAKRQAFVAELQSAVAGDYQSGVGDDGGELLSRLDGVALLPQSSG